MSTPTCFGSPPRTASSNGSALVSSLYVSCSRFISRGPRDRSPGPLPGGRSSTSRRRCRLQVQSSAPRRSSPRRPVDHPPRPFLDDRRLTPEATTSRANAVIGTVTRMIAGRPGGSSTLRRAGAILHLPYRYRQELLTARLRDILRIIRAAATTHSPRASGADDDVLTGRIRDCLRSIPARVHRRHRDVLGLIRAAAFASEGESLNPELKTEGKNCSPRTSGTSSGSSARQRRPSSPRASGADDDVLTGRLRDRLRLIRARVSAPFTGTAATPRFDPRGSLREQGGIFGPGVEDGGQDKRLESRVI
jgi:hypothetical protein